MGIEYVNKVISVMLELGFTTTRGYPTSKVQTVDGMLAKVLIEKAQETSITILVRIYLPGKYGGATGEDYALSAAEKLRKQGANCTVGGCDYDHDMEAIYATLHATFSRDKTVTTAAVPTVKVAGSQASYLVGVSTGFTCTPVRTANSTSTGMEMVSTEKRWTVTLEEMIPYYLSPVETHRDQFTVVVDRSGRVETYKGCAWDKITSETCESGTRRIRTAITCIEPTLS